MIDSSTKNTNQINNFIIEYIQEHYKKYKHPLMLATLGEKLQSENLALPPGMKLHSFLEKNFSDILSIERDEQHPAKIAVALQSNREAVRDQLVRGVPLLERAEPLTTLPWSLILAFIKPLDEGEEIYYPRNPPFRYKIASTPPGDNYFHINKSYRMEQEYIESIQQLDEPTREILLQKISKWMAENGLTPSSFSKGRQPSSKNLAYQEPIARQGRSSALHRLLAMQTPDVRQRMVIPGDIALLLLEHK